MFPTDAITIRQGITGTGNVVLASSTRTILTISQEKDNDAKVLSVSCGSDVITSLYTSKTNVFEQNMQYLCNNTLTFSTSGAGTGVNSFIITYVNRDISVNNFSSGDIISILLLICIFSALFFKIMKEWIFGSKVEGVSRVKIVSRL